MEGISRGSSRLCMARGLPFLFTLVLGLFRFRLEAESLIGDECKAKSWGLNENEENS